MSKKLHNDMPCSSGFWWARIGSYKWFNVLVEVYGDAPFLRLRGWDIANQRLIALESWNIVEWGPRIERPKDDPGNNKEITNGN